MSRPVTLVTFVLPSTLRRWVSGASEVRVFAVAQDDDTHPTLGTALGKLRRTHPLLEKRLCDEYGHVKRNISMFVYGQDTRRLGGLECAMPPGAEVYVLPALT
ncbi:ubiquitin family protein [Streptosporangium soli]|nr:hypothetical protein [Streptosporangium sp. KLBMP 9127]